MFVVHSVNVARTNVPLMWIRRMMVLEHVESSESLCCREEEEVEVSELLC